MIQPKLKLIESFVFEIKLFLRTAVKQLSECSSCIYEQETGEVRKEGGRGASGENHKKKLFITSSRRLIAVRKGMKERKELPNVNCKTKLYSFNTYII